MPTQIHEIDRGTEGIILRVEGEMLLDDARLVTRLAGEAYEKSGMPVTLDLADLDFIDSEAAHVLRRLTERTGFSIIGMEIFLQTAVTDAERQKEVR